MNLIRFTNLCLMFSLVLTSSLLAQDEKQAEEKQERPFLGIMMANGPDGKGVRINDVLKETPAASKLETGDLILKVDDVEVTEIKLFPQMLAQKKPGDIVKLLIQRDSKEIEVEVKLGVRPAQLSPPEPLVGFPEGKSVELDSEDGLKVTADLYFHVEGENVPVIVLCHQAGWSRGEYREIAPKLNELGFNCMAIDQRSGGEVNEVTNETAKRAKLANKETNFADAEQDMVAALKFTREKNPGSKVILWGSSYSSALALRLAGEQPELVDGVLAFAPGEYFVRFGKPEDWITSSAKKIKVPAFITSAKDEAPRWEMIFAAIPGDTKSKFVPESKGNHGSRALWGKFDDNEAYWKHVTEFLAQFK